MLTVAVPSSYSCFSSDCLLVFLLAVQAKGHWKIRVCTRLIVVPALGSMLMLLNEKR